MTKPPTERDAAGVRRWTCDGCGWVGPWTDTHSLWGSWKDIENQDWDLVVVMCSQACRDHLGADPRAALQNGLLPRQPDQARGRPIGVPGSAQDLSIDVQVQRRQPPDPEPGGRAA